ncbi:MULTISPECIES: 5-formyltetrahydrofolate cyclo-ligase [unclassified Neisseria]|uniref:5-formyltetrahydrofolate cyclo-ligase n=1 Tax=unclassified Neisseria TaxID=2623750 RepID=UPI001071CCD0|nr:MULTISPECIES: 5-formyltetrahydrofolate cyclo-ligase [unclassified Neisseria]MBF0804490.1 5-formyltetrahydrofolate cyclo-ligase [Neisseria sp. 19428wB4_WF04]TFU40506.1 5-formyltetrahydrofolate cyclo-ligase [Neisseria sp. WF04]
MNMQDKAGLRRRLRRARQSLGKSERKRAERAANCLLKHHIRRRARIGIYWPVGSELRLGGFIQTALARGARLYLPYIEPRSLRLWFTPYQADSRKAERRHSRGSLAIPQFGGRKIRAHRLTVLLVPLVGIDRQGYRLGHGGGYYDVTLAALKGRLKPHTVGTGFACQMCARLPHEAHDIALDSFVSEAGRVDFPARPA